MLKAIGFSAQTFAVPTVLGMSGIPFVGLSSGSVDANGAITGITALPIAYPNAYCWFPANILATTIAAGWHYCTFSTTTAGVAYLNTYSTGLPTVPSSTTAVTDGKGAFTGVTAEIFGPTISVPANGMKATGQLRIGLLTRWNNTGNNKTTQIRFSGNAGTVMGASTLTSQLGETWSGSIMNRGVTNVQTSIFNHADEAGTNRTAAPIAGAIDTTAATTVVFSTTRATATDNMVIESMIVELLANGT